MVNRHYVCKTSRKGYRNGDEPAAGSRHPKECCRIRRHSPKAWSELTAYTEDSNTKCTSLPFNKRQVWLFLDKQKVRDVRSSEPQQGKRPRGSHRIGESPAASASWPLANGRQKVASASKQKEKRKAAGRPIPSTCGLGGSGSFATPRFRLGLFATRRAS